MPSQVQIAARIDVRVRKAVSAYCKARGLKMSRFLEDALLDKLEEISDAEEISALRREPSRPFEEFVAELRARGRL